MDFVCSGCNQISRGPSLRDDSWDEAACEHCGTPKTQRPWPKRDEELPGHEVRELRALGVRVKQYRLWREKGCSPDDVLALRRDKVRLTDLDRWIALGVPLRQIARWRRSGLDDDQIAIWRHVGCTPEEAAAAIEAGVGPRDQVGLRHIVPDRVRRDASGISHAPGGRGTASWWGAREVSGGAPGLGKR